MTGASVLRVLNGRLAGTEKQLPTSGTVSIGHQFWQDVVIRDPATKGIAVDLQVDGEGGAQITVLTGEALLLGSHLGEGQTAILPAYVPFSIGGVALAWGDPESARWAEASGIAGSTPAPPLPPPSAQDEAFALLGKAGEQVSGWFTRKRAMAIGAVATVAAGAALAVPTMDALGLRGDLAARADHILDSAGLAPLATANDAATGGVIVSGVVSNDAERLKAQEVLRDQGIDATVNVQTSAELAQSAADVARIHGLQAMGRPISRTGVELRITRLTGDQRLKLAQAIRTDVRQLGRLVFRDDLPPREDSPLRTVADATKKVSTVVAGDPAYIQTVDGARYFAGAIMPSGHRLITIQGDTVFFEKNGRETQLKF
jgi:type III secretion protein D